MPLRVAIHQPNYAPWCGYFTKLAACDVFLFLDDVQLTKGGYTPRCRIRGAAPEKPPLWLTVPIHASGLIRDARFAGPAWPRKHLQTLAQRYARAPHLRQALALIEPLYADPGELLAPFNIRLIRAVASYLELPARTVLASDLAVSGAGSDRLINLVRAVGGDFYISGKGGQKYQDPAQFAAAGLAFDVHVYRPIPYDQRWGPDFVPGLSILDALFLLGRDARALLRYPD